MEWDIKDESEEKKKRRRCNLKRIPFFWDMAELLNTKIIINSFAE